MRVLIAEDELILRMIIQEALESFGYECLLAEDGEKAWEIFQSTQDVDVIINFLGDVVGVHRCSPGLVSN